MKMKKIFFSFLILFFFAGVSQALAERLILDYCQNGLLRVEYLGPKFNTWGPNDVEAVQWDRIRGVNPAEFGGYDPQIFLEIYDGRSPKKVSWAVCLPLGGEIAFAAEDWNIGCGTTFQIFADVWVGNQIQRKYWAIGPGEPIPSVLILHNVEKIRTEQGWVFRTTCCCP